MRKKTAVQEADSMLPKDVRREVQQTREQMEKNIAVERAMRESEEEAELRLRDQKTVEKLITDVTGEQFGDAGMKSGDLTRTKMSKYGHTPVRRVEKTSESPEEETFQEHQDAA